MIRFIKATSVCPHCERKFHQIDTTEERAIEVARNALARHVADDHAITEVPC